MASERSSEALFDRVRRLELIEEARGLLARYAELIDARAVDQLSSIFADDIVLTMPGRRFEGVARVIDFYRDASVNDPSERRHFVTNVHVAASDETAVTLASRFIYTAGTDGESVLGWGRYLDTFATFGAELRLAAKDIVVEHRGPVDATWGRRK
jgi:3-phenylpropionate/cinnamic acid dioxygenase small subunit